MPSPNHNHTELHETESFAKAYTRVQDEIEAVPEEQASSRNLDAGQCVVTALGALPALTQMRKQIVASFKTFDLVRFDKLHTYTMALAHAQSVYAAASTPPESVTELVNDVLAWRDRLHADCTSLSKFGLMDGERVAEFKSTQGYRNFAFDVLHLVETYRRAWGAVEGKTPVTKKALDQAAQRAQELISQLGEREQGQTSLPVATLRRQQAFALFVLAYDDARRAITYLRWFEGDVDSIIPSLYAGRGGRKKATDTEAAPSPKPAPTPPDAPVLPPVPLAPSRPGMPGSDPFGR